MLVPTLMRTPSSLKIEHEELDAELAALIAETGDLGAAAREVARSLHAHFASEEELAMPLLGLLLEVATGGVERSLEPAAAVAQRLKFELPRLFAEHRAIVTALEGLAACGARAARADVAHFVRKLRLHAQTEEEVLYPAAIVVGALIEAKLRCGEHAPERREWTGAAHLESGSWRCDAA